MYKFGETGKIYKDDKGDDITIIGGISYAEAPKLFKSKTKVVKIVFKDENGKDDKNGK